MLFKYGLGDYTLTMMNNHLKWIGSMRNRDNLVSKTNGKRRVRNLKLVGKTSNWFRFSKSKRKSYSVMKRFQY